MNLFKPFTNVWYKMFPPESVQYYKKSDSARAKLQYGKDGTLQMQIEGEKYPFNSFPRGPVLLNVVGKLKHVIKTKIFNAAWGEIAEAMKKGEYDMMPLKKCAPAVREMAKVLDHMVEMEVVEDMKERMRLLRNVIVFLAQEDDAYRIRMQYFFSKMNQNKVKLDKSDLYYARGKYWKADFDYINY